MIITFTVTIGGVIMAVASLSFLGFGLSPGCRHLGRDAEQRRAQVRRHPDLTMQDRGPLGASHRGTPLFAQHRVHTWSEHVVTEGEHVVGIAADAPTDLSCIIGCAVLTGAGAVQRTAGVRPGDSVAVIGAGGVGLSAIWMASMLEAYPIVAADLRDDKLEMARQFGATHLVNARNEDPVAAIRELTNGGVDYAFDTIGVRATSEQNGSRNP